MSWVGWLALAAALLLVSLPAPGAMRTDALTVQGRLRHAVDERPAATPGRTRWPRVAGVLAIGAVAVAAAGAGALIALAVAALCATGGVLVRDVLRRRAAEADAADLATALRVLVGELEAGSQSAVALTAAASAGPRVAAPFTAAAQVARRGGDAGSSLAAADRRGFEAIGAAWRLGDTTGTALAEVLGRVADDLRAGADQRRTVATALAGPRSSAALLSGLPALGIALGAAMGARPLPFLLGAPAGRLLCCAGVLLDVGGILWMRHIVGRAERP